MILKFQQGGGALPPLVSYTPVTVTGGQTTAAKEEKDEKADLTDKDLLKMLESLDGLPSDMEMITKSLQNFYIDQKYGPNTNTSTIASRYMQVLKQMKTANFHRKQYDEAFNIVKANGGLDEIAIDEVGRFVCMNNDGDFKFLSMDQLKETEGYRPLTNSELLQYRAYDKDTAFNNNILAIVQNGIGMETINKLINQSVTMLGSKSTQEQGYVRTDSKKLISGLEDYIQAVNSSQSYNTSIDNLYKINILTKSQAEQAKLAIDYVWDMLPTNAKTLLRTKTRNGSIQEAKNLVSDIIVSRTSTTENFSANLESSKGKSTSGSGSGGDDVKNDPVKSFVLGKGYSQPIGINIGNSYTHTVNGRYSILTDKSGKALGANSTLEDVTGSAYAGVLDINNATFGGVQLNTNQGRKVLLDSADIIGMDLPIDQVAKEKYGIVRPDLNMLSRLEQAENEIRYNNITNPEEINQIYAQFELPEKFKNENGSYNLNLLNYQRFARLSGVVEESALPEDIDLDNTVVEIDDDNFRSSIEEVLKSKDDKYNMSNGVFGWGGTELYKGAIYIPVREDIIAASLGSGDYYELPGSDATQVEKDWEQTQKVNGYVKPPSLGVK